MDLKAAQKNPSINIHIEELSEMNIFLYAGDIGSEKVTKKVLKDGDIVKSGQIYSIPVDLSAFLVVYPNVNKDKTGLKISYWLGEAALDEGSFKLNLW